MRQSGLSLSEPNWCLYKMRKFGHTKTLEMSTLKGNTTEGHGKKDACKPRREASEETSTSSWISSFQNHTEINFCWLSPHLWYFVTGALANQYSPWPMKDPSLLWLLLLWAEAGLLAHLTRFSSWRQEQPGHGSHRCIFMSRGGTH